VTIDLAAVEAIDFHVHAELGRAGEDGLRPEWRAAAAAYFGEHPLPTVEDVAAYYRERKLAAVVFTVDAETVTGRRAVPNEEIAEVAAEHPDVLIPFASLDPNKGARAVEEARRLVRDYDAIAIEALQVKGLARSALAKDVHDASWARFISMLRYKAERAGTWLIEVDPRNTTQDCSACGTKVPKELGDRRHECLHCGLSIDRDLNAARNILSRAGVGPGLHNVAGCGMRAGGNLSEPQAPPYAFETN